MVVSLYLCTLSPTKWGIQDEAFCISWLCASVRDFLKIVVTATFAVASIVFRDNARLESYNSFFENLNGEHSLHTTRLDGRYLCIR